MVNYLKIYQSVRNIRQKGKYVFLFFLLLTIILAACEKSAFDKPKELVKKNKMIDMLVDIHIAEATFDQLQHESILKNTSSSVFYYSVLEKYEVPDSVFEKSFVYYASRPKEFERMYREVMNKLSEKEQEFSDRRNKEIEFEESSKAK
ncbi:MAG: hypothetical protein CSA36_03515 [Draconibacterium sp.]|nr:MAG: hypothetical protein CSA36_03515 [Draconibacterium sp.]